jgi:hypothetical protein
MRTLTALMVLLVTCAGADAAFDRSGWTWQRSVELPDISGFVRLPIPPEVFDETQPTLNDLRIVDDGGVLVPHVIHWGRVREVRTVEWRPARLLNQTYAPGRYGRVVADFGEPAEKNQIKVNLSGNNYRRRVLLEGSDNGRNWEVVAQGLWLIDVSLQGQTFRVDTLKFPVNNFRYLRLTVYNIFDDVRRFAVQTFDGAIQRAEGEKELVQVAAKGMTTSLDEKNKQSIIELDLGVRNLPVVILRCTISTPYFHRAYELLGRNTAREKQLRKTETGWDTVERDVPWTSISRGVLYRIKYQTRTEQSLGVEAVSAPYRYLKLRIFNADNPPLEVKGLTVFRRDTSLVFEAASGRTYTLIGGNPAAHAPSYDLAKAVEGVDDFQMPSAALGALRPVDVKKDMPPWSERHSALIWTVLVAAVGVVLVLIVRNMKHLRAPRQE